MTHKNISDSQLFLLPNINTELQIKQAKTKPENESQQGEIKHTKIYGT